MACTGIHGCFGADLLLVLYIEIEHQILFLSGLGNCEPNGCREESARSEYFLLLCSYMFVALHIN